MEKLQYIRLRDEANPRTFELVVQLDGGGAVEEFNTKHSVLDVAEKLRRLAAYLEHGAKIRAEKAGARPSPG